MNMKKHLLVLPLLALTSCGQTEASSGSSALASQPEDSLLNSSSEVDIDTDHRVLIAYFSATGTTERIAGHIHDGVDSDLFVIVPVDPYTSEDLDYYTGGRCDQENADDAIRVEIANQVSGMADYDTVFLGYPIWFGKAPKIIWTFLEAYDFSYKTIIPFCTSGSTGISNSVANILSLAPSSTTVLEGRRFSGSSGADEVATWAKSQLATI